MMWNSFMQIIKLNNVDAYKKKNQDNVELKISEEKV